MDTHAFLNAVLPRQGVKFLTYGRRNPAYTFRDSDVASIAREAIKRSTAGLDTWNALASFDPNGALNKHQKLGRFAENAMFVRTAWMDWDVGGNGKSATLKEAGQEAVDFYADLLPTGAVPLFVRSGGGLHTYVVFDRDVPAADWLYIADRAKALGKHWGYRFDPTRAADLASVLRPAGTSNYKQDNPRPVVVVNPTTYTIVNWDDYADSIESIFDEEGIPLVATTVAAARDTAVIGGEDLAGLTSDFSLDISTFQPADYDKVLAKCQQMKWTAEHQSEVPEPMWRAALSIAGRCIDGQFAIHWISEKHPRYDKAETENKFAATPAPFSCNQFESQRPGGCDGCYYRGTIKSPIILGEVIKVDEPIKRAIKVIEAPIDVGTEEVPEFALPMEDIPALDKYGFKYSRGRLIKLQKVEVEDEDAEEDDEGKRKKKKIEQTLVLVPYPFHPINIYEDKRGADGTFAYEWFSKPPGSSGITSTISSEALGSTDGMMRWLAKIGYHPTNKAYGPLVIEAVKHWIDDVRAQATLPIPKTQGWFDVGTGDQTEKVFVIGKRMLTHKGVRAINTSTHLSAAVDFEPKGKLDEWLRILDLYRDKGAIQHQLAIMVGFAAPLIEMSPLSSMAINLYGKSGGGKTTLQYVISTIYGSPKSLVKGPEGTAMSQSQFIYSSQNLPVMFDDWYKVKPEDLTNRYFNWANGWNSEGLTRSGTFNKDRGGGWRTAIMLSTNTDIHDAIKNYFQGDKRAARMRVMQITIPTLQWGEEASTRTDALMQANYGVAGEVWLDYLRKNRKKVQQHIGEMQIYIEKNWEATSAERFFTQGCACIMVALYHASKIGLVPFDKATVLGAVKDLFDASKLGAQDVTADPSSVIASYINANLSSIITVVSGKPDDKSDKILSGDSRYLVVGRLNKANDNDYGELWLLLDPLRQWCKERHMNCNAMLRELYDAGYTTAVETSINLGHKLPTFNFARAKGIRLDYSKLM